MTSLVSLSGAFRLDSTARHILSHLAPRKPFHMVGLSFRWPNEAEELELRHSLDIPRTVCASTIRYRELWWAANATHALPRLQNHATYMTRCRRACTSASSSAVRFFLAAPLPGFAASCTERQATCTHSSALEQQAIQCYLRPWHYSRQQR